MSSYPRQDSDAVPHGSAGLVNQAHPGNVEEVGAVYGVMCEAARDAALAKRQADLADLLAVPNLAYPGEHADRGGY